MSTPTLRQKMDISTKSSAISAKTVPTNRQKTIPTEVAPSQRKHSLPDYIARLYCHALSMNAIKERRDGELDSRFICEMPGQWRRI